MTCRIELAILCALLTACPGDDGSIGETGEDTETGNPSTSPTTSSTSNPSTSSTSNPSTSSTSSPSTNTDTDTDTTGTDTDTDTDPSSTTGHVVNCPAQTDEASCLAKSDFDEEDCAWIPVELYGDDQTCQVAETSGICILALSDYDCGSFGPACGALEATPFYREADGGTEVAIIEWWVCDDFLPPEDFAACENGELGLEPAACNCACTD